MTSHCHDYDWQRTPSWWRHHHLGAAGDAESSAEAGAAGAERLPPESWQLRPLPEQVRQRPRPLHLYWTAARPVYAGGTCAPLLAGSGTRSLPKKLYTNVFSTLSRKLFRFRRTQNFHGLFKMNHEFHRWRTRTLLAVDRYCPSCQIS